MPIGGAKAGFFAAGVANENYFGDESLGNCQFGASGITQTSDTTAIDTVLTTGSEAGGPSSSSYGNGASQTVPNSGACYEFTVSNQSGTYDGDMVVLNFIDLTVDASVTITTERPCRGMLVYVSGDCVLNGAISMSSRGGHSDPTASGGGDASSVSATGLRLPLFTASGTDTLAAADFAGSGTASVAAVANQDGIDGNGTIFAMSQTGGAGATGQAATGAAGTTGGATLSTGGGGAGRDPSEGTRGDGGDGGVFSGGAGGGSGRHAAAGDGGDYGGAGGAAGVGGSGEGIGGGGGNPGGAGYLVSTCNGVGGIIWLIVKGDLTIASGGGCYAQSPQGYYSSHYGAPGAGGGCIFVLYAGTLSNSGTITAAGAPAGSVGHHAAGAGGAGGSHSMQIND